MGSKKTMKSKQYYRIQKLEREYSETNIKKGEVLPTQTVSRINKNYRNNQRKRVVDGVLNNVRNKDTIKEEVHQIIDDIPRLTTLCRGCKEEMIISVIILYVLKSRDSRYHVERHGLWKKYNITWQKYSLIISRLLQESRKSKKLPYQYDCK